MSLSQPLPERLRPSELALFVGQSHLAERLTTLLEGPRLPSLLLFGPPGCGKSTLALLLARARGGNVLRLSAPEAGLQQLRRQLTGVDILVLDELHRFSKAQQDFFLPLLESGDRSSAPSRPTASTKSSTSSPPTMSGSLKPPTKGSGNFSKTMTIRNITTKTSVFTAYSCRSPKTSCSNRRSFRCAAASTTSRDASIPTNGSP